MKRKLKVQLKTPDQMKEISFIPTGEIWIDKTLSKPEQRFLIKMESEHFWTTKNSTYEDAHKEAI